MMYIGTPQVTGCKANIHDLHQAVLAGMDDTVQTILDQDSVNVNATFCGTTALSLALYKEKSAIFKLLLCHECARNRFDLNKLSKDDKQRVEPPLVTACRLGNKQAVKLLIDCGAELDCPDNFQHTALWMATRQRHSDLVQLLIKSGASVNPSTLWTHSPLFFAVKYSSKRTEIAKKLVYNGACVNVHNGVSLLYCAIIQGDLSVAKLIVEAGYNVSKDERIREEFTSAMLTRNKALMDWLSEELTTPATLQQQCRTVIRNTISDGNQGKHFIPRLLQLPLPRSIITYLAIHDDVWKL